MPTLGEALGPTFLELLDALRKEYEKIQRENARLVVASANYASTSLHHQEAPDPVTRQVSPTSNKSSNESLVDQQLSSDEELSAKQQLPADHEKSTREVDSALVVCAPSSLLLPQKIRFEMCSSWQKHSELLHHNHDQNVVTEHSLILKEMSVGQYTESDSTTLAIHPESHKRHVWVLGCVCLLLIDLIWAPIDVCFDVAETPASKAMHYIGMMYWTLDILMSFLTGVELITHLEMRLRYIARLYAKSWLFFDILLVVPDWVELVAANLLPTTHLSFLRILRWGRFMRLLRMGRLAKVAKLRHIIRGLAARYHLSRMYVEVTRGFLGMICMVVVGMHIESCLWHGFGTLFADGWVQANSLGAASNGRLYAVSLHWSGDRLLGSNSGYDLKTAPELVVDTLLMFLSLLASAWLLSSITVLSITRTQSKPFNLWRCSVAYSIRHDLSHILEKRLAKWLAVSDFGNVGEIAEEEHDLLCLVPESLKRDLFYETRVPFLAHKQFIKDMVGINERAARQLCWQAITEVVLAPNEVIFAGGDAGQAMRFVSHGSFTYSISKSEDVNEHFNLQCGESLSEAVLWTTWEHVGQLSAVQDPMLLVLDHDLFACTVTEHRSSLVHAVKYAKLFVQKLNQQVPHVHDLTCFEDLNLDFVNDNIYDLSAEKHFIFISHYKVEAGTEATLMFEELKVLLTANIDHVANNYMEPVFVDSENLTDLAHLKEHVHQSNILLLLLTPGFLSRPWCLIEIATAIQHSVSIVLVDIQRPGIKFQYPDDKFYKKILAGKTLDPQSVDLLKAQGVTLESLVKGLRRIFCKISLPFSPHRSDQVREAELRDILKRCDFEASSNSKTNEW